jgi:hypothetical protein
MLPLGGLHGKHAVQRGIWSWSASCGRQSVVQFILVSGSPLGPTARFSFSLLFRLTIALLFFLFAFFYITFINSDRTSQETHYVSATEPNRLMLFRETVTVYCENHTEHTDTRTLCGQNAERTSQETHYVSATEPNRLMLFGETVADY